MAQAEIHDLDNPNYGYETEERPKFYFEKFHLECLPVSDVLVQQTRSQSAGVDRVQATPIRTDMLTALVWTLSQAMSDQIEPYC